MLVANATASLAFPERWTLDALRPSIIDCSLDPVNIVAIKMTKAENKYGDWDFNVEASTRGCVVVTAGSPISNREELKSVTLPLPINPAYIFKNVSVLVLIPDLEVRGKEKLVAAWY